MLIKEATKMIVLDKGIIVEKDICGQSRLVDKDL